MVVSLLLGSLPSSSSFIYFLNDYSFIQRDGGVPWCKAEDAPPYNVNTNSNNNLLLLDNQPLFGSRHWRSASAALDFLDGAMFKLGHAHCARINLHFICSCN